MWKKLTRKLGAGGMGKERKQKSMKRKTFLYEVESSGKKNSYVQHSDTKRLLLWITSHL